MKKILFMVALLFVAGCAHQKPEPDPTQIVQGKSIVIPPEFDVIPESAAAEEE